MKIFRSAVVLAVLFVLGVFSCFSQVNVTKELVWLAPQVQFDGVDISKRLVFEGQNTYDQVSKLPLVDIEVELENWDGDTCTIVVALSASRSVALNDTENSVVGYVEFPKPIVYNVFIEKKRAFLRAYVCPLQATEVAGRYLKMVSFSLDITYKKGNVAALKNVTQTNVASSVLAKGRWVKVSVATSGIHRINYSKLASWGFSNPEKVNVFGQGGKLLPSSNYATRTDDLAENAVWHHNNAIYFYAQGPVDWTYNSSKQMFLHKTHNYSSKGYYFLSEEGSGLDVSDAQNDNSQTPTYQTAEFDDYSFYEQETNNLLRSGNKWYGEKFGSGSLTTFDGVKFTFPNTVTSKSGRVSTEFISRAGEGTYFYVSLNESTTPLQSIYMYGVNLSVGSGAAASEGRGTSAFTPAGDVTKFPIAYGYSLSTSSGYLDKVDVQVRRKLIVVGSHMMFRDYSSIATGRLSRFDIETSTAADIVWDVTNYLAPKVVSVQGSDVAKWFVYPTEKLKQFVAFSPDGDLPTPVFVEEVPNQDLHALPQVDYLIVTTPLFLSQANRLAALHTAHNGVSVAVVEQSKIFNEFSSGCPDVTAIRSLVRMLYDRAGGNTLLMPKYLLLFGDGSFDNKDVLSTDNLLTYQSDNSIDHTGTYVSDDYFGFLDATEGVSLLTDAIDIGIGRFPASTVAEAKILVDKSENYMLNQANNQWRTSVTFLADDEDDTLHINQADQLTRKVAAIHPEYNLNKIYLDTYPQTTTSSGQRYPDVELLIDKALADGTLIFNYTGHGGGGGLTAERVITVDRIKKWSNSDRLPLFMTATCEFSAYDQVAYSAGEYVILNAKGGGIALLTTTRVVYANENYELNRNFYDHALEKDSDGMPYRMGDISRLTKRATSATVNKLNFTLLGDPALRLGTTSLGVEVTKINGVAVAEAIDTLKALLVASISGQVVDANGNLLPSYNGTAIVSVYDKLRTITTRGNDKSPVYKYNSYESILFSGKVAVVNGEFSITFKVPKDILYDVANGRISVFATNGTLHASGYFDKVKIGGYESDGIDTQGPQVGLWLNDTTFVNGGDVGSTPLFIARIFDENGINTSNSSVGHDIVLSIDGGKSGRYILNSSFNADLNSYQSGSIRFQLPELDEGQHTLTFTVWDTYNNSFSQDLDFVVENSSKLKVKRIVLYPNPVSTGQQMAFSVVHNDPYATIDVKSTLYSMSGTKLGEQTQTLNSSGVQTDVMYVNMVAGNGVPLRKGIYLLQFELDSESGRTSEFCQKIVVTE